MAGVVAPDTAAAEQAQGSHNKGQGELGVLCVLCVQCILLLGSLPEGGPRTRCTGWSRCRTQETLEVCRKVAGRWGTSKCKVHKTTSDSKLEMAFSFGSGLSRRANRRVSPTSRPVGPAIFVAVLTGYQLFAAVLYCGHCSAHSVLSSKQRLGWPSDWKPRQARFPVPSVTRTTVTVTDSNSQTHCLHCPSAWK